MFDSGAKSQGGNAYDLMNAVPQHNPDLNPIIKPDALATQAIQPGENTLLDALRLGSAFDPPGSQWGNEAGNPLLNQRGNLVDNKAIQESDINKVIQKFETTCQNFGRWAQSYIGTSTSLSPQEINDRVYYKNNEYDIPCKHKNGVMLPEYQKKMAVVKSEAAKIVEEFSKHLKGMDAEGLKPVGELPNNAHVTNTGLSLKATNFLSGPENVVAMSSSDNVGYSLPVQNTYGNVSVANDPAKSSELEDQSVLSAIDFATVQALNIHYRDWKNDDLMYDYLKKIDEIRMKPEYEGRYSQSDENGFGISGSDYSTRKGTARIYAVKAEMITDRNRFAHDETFINVGSAMTVFFNIPKEYVLASSLMALGATTPPGELPTVPAAALTGLGLWDNKLGKAATVFGAVYSQNNLSVQVGDIEVVVSVRDRGKSGDWQITNSYYLFSNTGELKRKIYEQPIATPSRYAHKFNFDN
jgi:hypothetical protein